jgi:hypothetical protein
MDADEARRRLWARAATARIRAGNWEDVVKVEGGIYFVSDGDHWVAMAQPLPPATLPLSELPEGALADEAERWLGELPPA